MIAHRTRIVVFGLAAVGGCASVHSDGSRQAIVTRSWFSDSLSPWAKVEVAGGSTLYPAMVGGKPAYCTAFGAYSAPLERRPVCFFDTSQTGYLTSYYVTGTLESLNYDVHIPYQSASETLKASATPAEQSPSSSDAELDEVRAKQLAGVKLTLPEARLLVKAEREGQQAARRDAATQAAVQGALAVQRAKADCAAQAQMAVINTPGIVPALLAGVATGNVCQDYYRNIGVSN